MKNQVNIQANLLTIIGQGKQKKENILQKPVKGKLKSWLTIPFDLRTIALRN